MQLSYQPAATRGICSSSSIGSMHARRLTGRCRAAADKSEERQHATNGLAEVPPPQQPGARRLTEVVAQPTTALATLAGFAAVASQVVAAPPSSDVAGAAQAAPLSLDAASSSSVAEAAAAAPAAASSLLLQMDQAVHTYVATHTTLEFQLMADVLVSDAAITVGVAGWLACTAVCLVKAPSRSAGVLALCWAVYFATVGAVVHGDPPLVDWLKHVFARARPSTLHHSFSYPSGHTAAAVFAVGAFLFVLLPLTMHCSVTSSDEAGNAAAAPGGPRSSSSAGAAAGAGAARLQLLRAPAGVPDGALLLLWGAAWVSTAAGRIMSESHWLSDTLAGGLLAVSTVSGLAWATNWMLRQQQLSSGGARGGDDNDGGGSGNGPDDVTVARSRRY